MKLNLIIAFSILLCCLQSWSYPDFIGYGYRSCLACHESGTGGGALTDYGRGVFASEIAANPFSKWMNDEEQAQVSNFLGKKELPWWIRLGIKYRSLSVRRSPGSSLAQTTYYNMQNDLNLNLFANQDHTIGFISTVGYIENPTSLAPNRVLKDNSYLYMREYFAKVNFTEEFWVYTGFMDKTFGIKTANHTAYNRARLSLGQNDQIHGILFQWARPDEDLFFHGWLGNVHLPNSERWRGGSIMLDKKWGSNHAYGINLLSEKKETDSHQIVALHNKMGFEKGNSILLEVGYETRKLQLLGADTKANTQYLFTQNQINLARGYFLTSSLELNKVLTATDPTDNTRWDIGLLMFPMQKMEFRASVINTKVFNSPQVARDQWSLQSQIHLSL